ncbi:MAG: SEC-C domain-containing protein, partial [Rhizobiales bacterium]|nr:SEC-C domain-containing protein [Hyphomicrobiales bacterium]
GMLQKLGLKEDEAIVHPWINRALEKAQQKVEARNFDIRKNLLKYDDVMNDQRKVIFEQRVELMAEEDVGATIEEMRHEVTIDLVARHIPERAYPEQWDAAGLHEAFLRALNLDLPVVEWAAEEGIADAEVRERSLKAGDDAMAAKLERFSPEVMRQVEKAVLLQTLDHLWREHLVTLDHLRQVIGFRGYAQRDPLNEYKTEAFELFEAMLQNLRETVTGQMMRVEIMQSPPLMPQEVEDVEPIHVDPLTGGNEMDEAFFQSVAAASGVDSVAVDPNDPSTWGKVQRNAPCPCGSGKKFKHCHGRFA